MYVCMQEASELMVSTESMSVAHLDLRRIQVVEFAFCRFKGPEYSHSRLWDRGGPGITNLQTHNNDCEPCIHNNYNTLIVLSIKYSCKKNGPHTTYKAIPQTNLFQQVVLV